MPRGVEQPLYEDGRQETGWIEQTIRPHLTGKDLLQVLEAGCGRSWSLDLQPSRLELTGIDLDSDALEYRKHVVGDLSHAILGDLGQVDLPDAQFDLIYSAYVLEHVRGVPQVLHNFDRWLRPGGIIVLRLPDRDSVVGFFARLVPFRLHVWFYRYVLRFPDAGRDGRGPFPTIYDKEMSTRGLASFFNRSDYSTLGVAYCVPFPGRSTRLWQVLRLISGFLGKLSVGHLSGRHNNFTIVARKKCTQEPRVDCSSP